jgi:hypothetical protein
MMGSKKASEIKQELRRVLGQNAIELNTWLEKQRSEMRPQPGPNANLQEELAWVQEVLREAAAEKKPATGKGKRKAKRTPPRIDENGSNGAANLA